MTQLTMTKRRKAVNLLHKSAGTYEALGQLYSAGGIETEYLRDANDMREVAEFLQECEAIDD